MLTYSPYAGTTDPEIACAAKNFVATTCATGASLPASSSQWPAQFKYAFKHANAHGQLLQLLLDTFWGAMHSVNQSEGEAQPKMACGIPRTK